MAGGKDEKVDLAHLIKQTTFTGLPTRDTRAFKSKIRLQQRAPLASALLLLLVNVFQVQIVKADLLARLQRLCSPQHQRALQERASVGRQLRVDRIRVAAMIGK